MPRKQVAEPTARAISLVQEKSRAGGIADDMAVADHRARPRTKSDRSELPAKLGTMEYGRESLSAMKVVN
jgi:hypothetical protein